MGGWVGGWVGRGEGDGWVGGLGRGGKFGCLQLNRQYANLSI